MNFRSLPLLAAALAASMACREDTAAQPADSAQYAHEQMPRSVAVTDPLPSALVPHIPVDRSIRRELNFALARDPELKERNLSFIVSNGDVRVTGVVRTESERERINDLALCIPGVKSVANAVRVSP